MWKLNHIVRNYLQSRAVNTVGKLLAIMWLNKNVIWTKALGRRYTLLGSMYAKHCVAVLTGVWVSLYFLHHFWEALFADITLFPAVFAFKEFSAATVFLRVISPTPRTVLMRFIRFLFQCARFVRIRVLVFQFEYLLLSVVCIHWRWVRFTVAVIRIGTFHCSFNGQSYLLGFFKCQLVFIDLEKSPLCLHIL